MKSFKFKCMVPLGLEIEVVTKAKSWEEAIEKFMEGKSSISIKSIRVVDNGLRHTWLG